MHGFGVSQHTNLGVKSHQALDNRQQRRDEAENFWREGGPVYVSANPASKRLLQRFFFKLISGFLFPISIPLLLPYMSRQLSR